MIGPLQLFVVMVSASVFAALRSQRKGLFNSIALGYHELAS
jgi:hypothetical protein